MLVQRGRGGGLTGALGRHGRVERVRREGRRRLHADHDRHGRDLDLRLCGGRSIGRITAATGLVRSRPAPTSSTRRRHGRDAAGDDAKSTSSRRRQATQLPQQLAPSPPTPAADEHRRGDESDRAADVRHAAADRCRSSLHQEFATLLASMTGFGEARGQAAGLSVHVEVRTINNRHFKLGYRSSDGYASLEPEVESVVRQRCAAAPCR